MGFDKNRIRGGIRVGSWTFLEMNLTDIHKYLKVKKHLDFSALTAIKNQR